MSARPRACLTFIGDLTRDSRALRFIDALNDEFEVHVITGSSNEAIEPDERYIQHNIPSFRNFHFKFGLIHYYFRAIPLARKLQANLYIASDLYSLPLAHAGAKKNDAPLIYDSRELYSSIAALHERKFTQNFWTWIENKYASNARVITTVNQSIADILQQKFSSQRIEVIHNYPVIHDVKKTDLLRTTFRISPNRKILLSQGGLQKGRGAFMMIDALQSLNDCVLVFLGSGNLKEDILDHAKKNNIADRVYLLEAVPSKVLLDYTASADIGLCLIENSGMSYYLSLPNKLFEYIAAGIPVIGSNFPEIKNVIEKKGIGLTIDPDNIVGITASIRKLLRDTILYNECVENCNRVKDDFNWKHERVKLLTAFKI